MDKKYQISPCGINCLNCGLHESNLTDEVKRKGAEFFNISPEEVKCRGCRQEQGKCLYVDSVCATWTCAEKKGVTYCFECDEFPCAFLAPAADKSANRAHNIKLYNLCRIKRIGADTWLDESATILKRYFEGELIPGKGPVLSEKEKQHD